MGRRYVTLSLVLGALVLAALGQPRSETADHVTLTTPLGKIVIRLRTDAAPQSSAMFARLARSGVYNGCTFYRAEDFCIQGGLRMADGRTRANPLGHFPFEYGLPNKKGTVTLARWEDVNSATGEFFINLKDSPHLDRTGTTGWKLGFAVFGEVESGMDVVQQIARLPTHSQGGMSMLAEPLAFQAQAQGAGSLAAAAPAQSMFSVAPAHLSIEIDQLGVVQVELLPKNAPHLVAAIQSLAQQGRGGRLHRAEAIPPPPSQGPPYALIQATLQDPEGTLAKMPHEGALPIGLGSVCIIPGTSEIFISLSAHPGWEKSMTIVGQVEIRSLQQVVMPILQRAHHDFRHPTYGTVMSMLDSPLQIHLSLGARASTARTLQKTIAQSANSEDAQIQAAEAISDDVEQGAGFMLRGLSGYKDL